MAVIEFLDVHLPDVDPGRIPALLIDSPATGGRFPLERVQLSGWVLGHPTKAVAIELLVDGAVVARTPVNRWRMDVASDYADIVGAERSGFKEWVDLSGLASDVSFQLVVVLADDSRLRIAHGRARTETTADPGVLPIRNTSDRVTAALIALQSAAPRTLDDWIAAGVTGPETPPPGPLPRCSIVIPVHNKAALTRQCLDTLLHRDPSDPPFEIIVVDDASADGTRDLLRAYGGGVRAVTLPDNAGFAGACNAGAAAARGDYLVFLNNDTVPRPGWLGELARHADVHRQAAVVGAKLLYPDETIQHAGVAFGPDRYPHHLYAGFPGHHPAVNVSRRFRAVTAACMLVRRMAFEAVGGFDRAFVNGWEDVDLCLKLGELGHEVHYCHRSVVFHLESASRNVRAERELRNRSLYADRWLDRIEPDSVRYYLEDGLMWLAPQGPLYPVSIQVSPLLATLTAPNREASKVLAERANQVAVLQRANVLLYGRVAELQAREADLSARLTSALGEPPPPSAPPGPRTLAESRVNWPKEGLTYRVVSVVLPLVDGALPADLPARLLGQRRGHGIELVAIVADESNVEALRQAGAAVVVAPPDSPPGALRNLAAAYAKGVVLVYVDPGTAPADDAWLANLLAPLDEDPSLAVVTSQVASDGDGPSPGASGRTVFALDDRATVVPGTTERSHQPEIHLRGTAVRTDVVAEVPFPDGGTADDDRAWAEAVLAAGYAIQHEPTALVRG